MSGNWKLGLHTDLNCHHSIAWLVCDISVYIRYVLEGQTGERGRQNNGKEKGYYRRMKRSSHFCGVIKGKLS